MCRRACDSYCAHALRDRRSAPRASRARSSTSRLRNVSAHVLGHLEVLGDVRDQHAAPVGERLEQRDRQALPSSTAARRSRRCSTAPRAPRRTRSRAAGCGRSRSACSEFDVVLARTTSPPTSASFRSVWTRLNASHRKCTPFSGTSRPTNSTYFPGSSPSARIGFAPARGCRQVRAVRDVRGLAL